MKQFLREKKLMVAGIGGALVVLGLVVGAMFIGPLAAFAAPLQTSPTPTSTPAASSTTTFCSLYQQNLAKSLNVSSSTLSQDRKTAAINAINQLVKDGKIKQARATQLEQRIDKSNATGCNFPSALRRTWIAKVRAQIIAQVAPDLHLSTSQLVAQLKAGKSLQDVANAQHVSASSLQTAVTNALNNTLKQAVSNGKLTQKRATAITTFIKNHPKFVQNLTNRHFKKATTSTAQ